jgi:hypothetical protein
MAIPNNCFNLRQLNLAFAHQCTDKVVRALAQRCSSLSRLDISACTRLTDLSLLHLREARNLLQLDLSFVDGYALWFVFVACFCEHDSVFSKGGICPVL